MVAASQIAPKKRMGVMNDQAADLDQTDEEILTYTVSDEALEATASQESRLPQVTKQMSLLHNTCC
jgi:hypothetical protein